jgi:hypothetical protein
VFLLTERAGLDRLLKNKHRAVSQGIISSKHKAQGSRLKGKDPIRSAFSFQLRAFRFQM